MCGDTFFSLSAKNLSKVSILSILLKKGSSGGSFARFDVFLRICAKYIFKLVYFCYESMSDYYVYNLKTKVTVCIQYFFEFFQEEPRIIYKFDNFFLQNNSAEK